MKKLLLAIALCLVVGRAEGAVSNWTGAINSTWGTAGNWDNGVPSSTVGAIFNAASPSCGIFSAASAQGINCTGYTGNITLGNGITLTVNGSVTLSANGFIPNTATATILMVNNGTLVTAGNTLGTLLVNASNATVNLGDDIVSTTGGINVTSGNFNTNGYGFTAGYFLSGVGNARNLSFVGSTMYITRGGDNTDWWITSTNLGSCNLSNSTIYFTKGRSYLLSSNLNYETVVFNGTGGINTLAYNNNFSNLSRIGSAAGDNLQFSGGNAFTVTNSFTVAGKDGSNLTRVLSSFYGGAAELYLTNSSVNISNASFRDIYVYGNVTGTCYAEKDNYLAGAALYQNTNYGTATATDQLNSDANASYLVKFNLTNATGDIGIVKMYLYESIRGSGHKLVAARMLRDWGENTSNFTKYDGVNAWGANGAGLNGTDYTTVNQTASVDNQNGGWVIFNIEPCLRDILATNNYGFRVYAPAGNPYDTFYTKEAGSQNPYLKVYSAINLTGTAAGDEGGNRGIIFTPSKKWYWYKNAGNWTNTSKWFDGSGGTGNASTHSPLPQDDVEFDSSSFDAASQTVTQDTVTVGRNINWTSISNTPTWYIRNAAGQNIYGSLALTGGMALSVDSPVIYFLGRDNNYYVATAGLRIPSFYSCTLNGTLYQLDDMAVPYYVHVQNGTYDANDFNLTTVPRLEVDTATVYMGNGTWYMPGYGSRLAQISASATIVPEGSLIYVNATANPTSFYFTNVNKQYNNITIANNSASVFSFGGNNTFNYMEIQNGRTVNLTAGHTQTVSSWASLGTAASPVILKTQTAGSAANIVDASGTNYAHYTNISDIAASGGATWDATDHCVNVTGATGWLWEAVGGAVQAAKNWVSWDD